MSVTVWSVARQGSALRDRELAELRNQASQAAAEHLSTLQRDLQRTFIAARLAWQAGQAEQLAPWLEWQRPWSSAVLRTGDGEWTTFPLAPSREATPVVTELLAVAEEGGPAELDAGTQFRTVRSDDGATLVLAVQRLAPAVWLGLVAPAAELVERCWTTEGDVPWQIRFPGQTGVTNSLCSLGPAFGDAELVPSDATARQLAGHEQRRLILLVATAVGTAGGWAVVIWMMLGALARQRELVRLQRRFVADVSHELKTPLTMIRLLAETLQDGRVRDATRQRTYYETITREAERLSVLLDGILDFSRIESERHPHELVDCDVADVARQAWSLFEPQFEAEGFERRIEITPNLPRLRADADALQQVFVNLLQNAYRYAGEGKYVRLSVARDGYLIVITVEDHGIGMTRAQLQRLGDSFFRAEDTRVRQTRGTGLGLAIVNHIVQAHGGKLEAHSRPNQGSTFTVWLPFEPTGDDRDS